MVKDNKLALINIFASINGEGYAAGKPTVFIRTMYCNLRCSYCDTRECWSEENFQQVYPDRADYMWLTAEEIFNRVEELERNWLHKSICLTGGEPLMAKNKDFMIEQLLPLFVSAHYDVGVETDGGVDYTDYKKIFGDPVVDPATGAREGVTIIADYKLPHSKMNALMLKSNFALYSKYDLVKMVISDDPADWEALDWVVNESNTKASIYISPCFGEVTMNKIPEYIMAHADKDIRAQLQIHKFFWPFNKRDV